MVRGQNSDKNEVKQIFENGQKKPRVTKTRLVWHHGHQELQAAEWRCIQPRVKRFFTVGLLHVESVCGRSWTVRIGRVTLHDCEVAHNWWPVPFFGGLFECLPIRILTSDLHHWILQTEIYQIRAYDFSVQLLSDLIDFFFYISGFEHLQAG